MPTKSSTKVALAAVNSALSRGCQDCQLRRGWQENLQVQYNRISNQGVQKTQKTVKSTAVQRFGTTIVDEKPGGNPLSLAASTANP
jgi:hypothetical protein